MKSWLIKFSGKESKSPFAIGRWKGVYAAPNARLTQERAPWVRNPTADEDTTPMLLSNGGIAYGGYGNYTNPLDDLDLLRQPPLPRGKAQRRPRYADSHE